MEEIQPLKQQDTQINGGGGGLVGAAPLAENVTAAKRQRRPSVRLGEIGDQPAATVTLFHESHRRPKHWRSPSGKDPAGKSSKTRQLAKFGAGSYHPNQETLDLEEEDRDSNLDNLAIGSWRSKDLKPKKAAKKPRTNWIPKIGDDDFDEQSPANSLENVGVDDGRGGGESQLRTHQSSSRVRVEEETDHNNGDDEVQLDVPSDRNGGVKNWLNGLGLGRYWPVFEVHEVDEEVLPWLTLEDLKDMGISAVGSRRKMFCAIQMLGKGFS